MCARSHDDRHSTRFHPKPSEELHAQEIAMKSPFSKTVINRKTLTTCAWSHDEIYSVKILSKFVKKCEKRHIHKKWTNIRTNVQTEGQTR